MKCFLSGLRRAFPTLCNYLCYQKRPGDVAIFFNGFYCVWGRREQLAMETRFVFFM